MVRSGSFDAAVIRNRRALVVTTCSASKRFAADVRVGALSSGPQQTVEADWLALVSGAKPAGPAVEVYRGRAFGLALRAARAIGADVGIVSAGLGYITGASEIPSYDITLQGRSAGSVRTRVNGSFDSAGWWNAVRLGPFATGFAVDAADRPLVLACVSRPYAEMFGSELLEAVGDPRNVRIFGLNVASALPERLRPAALPYDERLSSVGMTGTRVDFAQRALLHYVGSILPAGEPLGVERKMVAAALSDVRAVPAPLRTRLSDEAIRERIRALVGEFGPKRTRILAHLRAVEMISCEQSRFGSLFESIERELRR